MTALEACEKIEGAINDLHDETANSEWELSYTKPNTDEEHLEDYKGALAKTRSHFDLGETSEAWFVTTSASNATLAWCGNSPTAIARARYLSWVNPTNIKLLIARLKKVETELAAIRDKEAHFSQFYDSPKAESPLPVQEPQELEKGWLGRVIKDVRDEVNAWPENLKEKQIMPDLDATQQWQAVMLGDEHIQDAAPELPVRPQEEGAVELLREAIAFWDHPSSGEQYAEQMGEWRERVRVFIGVPQRPLLKPSNPAPTSESQAAPRQDGKL